MRCKSILFFLFLLPSLVVAQYDSNGGRFRVQEKKGCAPFTVEIIYFVNSPYFPTWGDNTSGPQDTTKHTYIDPGTYTLRLGFQSGTPADEITITVTANTQPAFDVYTCGNREVQVKVTDTNYDSYFINYDYLVADVSVPKGILATDNYTYGSTGLDTISVRGKNINAADNCTPAIKLVDIVSGLTSPTVDLLTVTTASKIDIDLTNSLNTLYRVEIATNSSAAANFQLAQTIHDIDSATISSLRTDDNYYCFRVGAFDPCNNINTYSNIICSANFDATAQNNQNYLTWVTSSTPTNTFSLDRDGTTLPSVTSPYIDPSICKTDSCYQLITNYSNGSQSISLQKCVTAFSNDIPAAITDITSVVGNGVVDLNWQPALQADEYSMFRKTGSGTLTLISTTSTPFFSDTDYTTNGSFCYQVNYDNDCGNSSPPGIETCPIRLIVNIANDNSITLSWSDYTGWSNGVDRYIVEKYDDEGVLLNSFDVGLATTLEDDAVDPDNQVYVYIVRAEANDPGLGQSISNEIKAIKEPNLLYPTSFTPNGDNLNDSFVVIGQFVSRFELHIFNRWGELLFSTNNLEQGWDGKYKGNTQPEGTYTFVANLTDLSGKTFKRSGSVVLLNKK